MNQWIAERVAAALIGLAVCQAAAAAPAFEDSIAQRAQACIGCHGKEGRAASDGYYPRIAGKPADYLYHQLINFREGRRRYALMTQLLAPLSDDYLRELAGYFAGLELPYPAAQVPTSGTTVLERGRELALRGDAQRKMPACTRCHGEALMGVAPAIPALLGLPRDYVNGQFGAWRTHSRRAATPDCMAHVADRMTPQDVDAVSQWLAAQVVPVSARAASALPSPLPEPCGGVNL